ncbi:MAG: CAAX prenyl protease-related protein [Tepidisphaeraceae bacterium]|jgi:CAAX protease family protein
MTVEESSSPQSGKTGLDRWISDDVAYVLPMLVFLLFTFAAGHWPAFFPWSYILKTVAAGWLLILFRKHYTKIKWNYAWLGAVVGVLGLVQWVGMEKLLLHVWPNYPRASLESFDPFTKFSSPLMLWTFVTFRLLGPALVVPFMEELFWRDVLWRTIIAPNDFKLAEVGEWDPKAFIVVTIVFASVHMQMWLTALVWGLMIAVLLVRTRSLGACIIAHAVTNLLLGVYVLYTHDWAFW